MHPIEVIFSEIEQVFAEFDHMSIECVAMRLAKAKRIFVAGEGRSGFMGKAFAMRLMHLGATVYAVGENGHSFTAKRRYVNCYLGLGSDKTDGVDCRKGETTWM